MNQPPDLTGKVILIAEDEQSNFFLLEEYLNGCNAKILWALDGEEAIKMVRKNTVDLILMDIKMPRIDGEKALKIIRKEFPHLTIIAQTAYAFSGEVEELLRSGFDSCITKPIKKEKLFNVLHTCLKV